MRTQQYTCARCGIILEYNSEVLATKAQPPNCPTCHRGMSTAAPEMQAQIQPAQEPVKV